MLEEESASGRRAKQRRVKPGVAEEKRPSPLGRAVGTETSTYLDWRGLSFT